MNLKQLFEVRQKTRTNVPVFPAALIWSLCISGNFGFQHILTAEATLYLVVHGALH